jgi:hypothetical protein
MLILAHLLTCNRNWNKTPIRLIRMASPDQRQEAERELRELAESARIETLNVIVTDETSFSTAFAKYSSNASAIFLGFVTPQPADFQEFYDRITGQLADMPMTFLVSSSGDTDIDS